jgi:hypothetical protein
MCQTLIENPFSNKTPFSECAGVIVRKKENEINRNRVKFVPLFSITFLLSKDIYWFHIKRL